jgi:preprotein translocase subunit SecA
VSVASLLFDVTRKDLKRARPIVRHTNELEPEMRALTDEQLRAKTDEFRERIEKARQDARDDEWWESKGREQTLNALLPEAFAVVREAAWRVLGGRQIRFWLFPVGEKPTGFRREEVLKPFQDADAYEAELKAKNLPYRREKYMAHFDCQLIGGMVLHEGKAAEMKTGEGKTQVATLPLYLNALDGRGAHLVTVNEYLARVGAVWMGPIYDLLGLSVGVITPSTASEHLPSYRYEPGYDEPEGLPELRPVPRREAYQCDVVYGTNNEFGFDYLRDNLAMSADDLVQRELNYAIVDEVDSILIDEARTPLIIAGDADRPTGLYVKVDRVVRALRKEEDYVVDEKARTAVLTDAGQRKCEQGLGVGNLNDPEHVRLYQHTLAALRAHACYHRDVHYVVQNGQVIIVDEFTGRMMYGRRYAEGLHQAIEAKEGVKIERESQTIASITFQNLFRLYHKLSGMTGTAKTEEQELIKIYAMPVVVIPTNEPVIRADDADVIYKTEEAKLRGIVGEILRTNGRSQPALVGTRSIEVSERLSERLKAENLKLFAQQSLIWRRLSEMSRLSDGQAPALSSALRDRHVEVRRECKRLEEALEVLAEPDPRRVSQPEEIREIERRLRKLSDLSTAIERLGDQLNNGAGVSGGDLRKLADIICYQALEEVRQARVPALCKALGIDPDPVAPDNVRALADHIGLEPGAAPHLGELLDTGIPHQVLNAKYHEQEAEIIKHAGERGAVTIATNMAGRGVDIKLGEGVRELGGLHILGTERHESRRIDNQLRGRSGRQGDPGSSRFYVSWDDELLRLFGTERVEFLMRGWLESEPIQHKLVSGSIERAQRKVEDHNFSMREHVLKYDDVLNFQREKIYAERRKVLQGTDLKESMLSYLDQVVAARVGEFAGADMRPEDWDLESVYRALLEVAPIHRALVPTQLGGQPDRDSLRAYLREVSGVAQRAGVLRQLEALIAQYVNAEAESNEWDLEGLASACRVVLPVRLDFTAEDLAGYETQPELAADLRNRLLAALEAEGGELTAGALRQVDRLADQFAPGDDSQGWDILGLCDALSHDFPEFHTRIAADYLARWRNHEDLVAGLQEIMRALYADRERELGAEQLRELERLVTLRVVTTRWIDHLDAMDYLEEGIRLRAYGQRDPLIEYQNEAYQLWTQLLASIQQEIVQLLFRVQLVQAEREQPRINVQALGAGGGEEAPERRQPVRLKEKDKVGRNDPCPCGSGKKYKKCCMTKQAAAR